MSPNTPAMDGDGTMLRDLGGPEGFGHTALERMDDGWLQLDVSAVFPDGLRVGERVYAAEAFYVNNDGTVSLGQPLEMNSYGPLPSDEMVVIAPFWADVDTRLSGESPESGRVWVHQDTAQDVITLTWDHVGAYRFNAVQANAFQMQLVSRGGGDLDVILRYEQIEWTQGDLVSSQPAFIGMIGPDGTIFELAASRDAAALLALDQEAGNSGAAGLWLHALRDGDLVTAAGGDGTDGQLIIGSDTGSVLAGGEGNDTLLGGAGDDTLQGSSGADLMDGGGGRNQVSYSAASVAVTASLEDPAINTGWAAGDQYFNIRDLVGTPYDDVLYGDGGNNFINGGWGDDTVYAVGGNNVLVGGMGNDLLIGGPGNDVLNGGPGHDTLIAGEGNNRLRGGPGRDLLQGGPGNDILVGDAGDDTLVGGTGNDRLFGGMGNDLLISGPGRNLLNGGPGNDTLIGGGNVDTLRGGSGNDVLTGGGGADIFVFTRDNDHNIITDFVLGRDRLFLRHDLWEGTLEATEVVAQHGTLGGDEFVLDFSDHGGTVIVLQGITDEGFAQLAGDILITM